MATDPSSPDAAQARWSVGGRLMESLATRDFVSMATCLDGDVRLRALLPFGPLEINGRHEVAGWFRAIFGGAETLELVDGTVGEVGSRLYLRWRLNLTSAGPTPSRTVVEQHVFATTGTGISNLDLLCSGFVSEPNPLETSKREVPCQPRL